MSETCWHCGGALRQLHTHETDVATHESVKCRACGRAGLVSRPVDGRVRRFGQAFSTARSLTPGSRGQATGRTREASLSGRTDRGGVQQLTYSDERFMSTAGGHNE